jgi:hypothetical protein
MDFTDLLAELRERIDPQPGRFHSLSLSLEEEPQVNVAIGDWHQEVIPTGEELQMSPSRLAGKLARQARRDHLIVSALENANLKGFGGDCGRAARAINSVLFDQRGKIVFAVNRNVVDETGPFVGHVACRGPEGQLWDGSGGLSEADLREWAIISPQMGSNYNLTEEERSETELISFWHGEEMWTRSLSPEEREQKKRNDLQRGLEEAEKDLGRSLSSF